MNSYLEVLFEEHTVIVNAIDVASNASALIGKDNDKYEHTIRQLLNFFRLYADQYHHHKEEMILFPELSKRNELLGEGVIREMFDNHADFREMIRVVEIQLDSKNFTEARKALEKYTEALLYHIAVENEELFQAAETLLSDAELENIYYRFLDCDRELGEKIKQDWVDLSQLLGKQLILNE